jgi:hypothetical protein
MDNLVETKIGRFDQVKLLTTKNVAYLSAPPGTDVSPQGLWSVVSAIDGDELLLAQKSALIRIPAADVLLVAGYKLDKLTEKLGSLSRGKEVGQKTGTSRQGPEATD